MKSIDLFAGCGGLSLGFKQAGIDISFASDFKEYAAQTYQNFFNEEFIVDDILSLEENNWAKIRGFRNKINIVAGGPPCQGFSNANRQRIKDDPRNKLYRSFMSCINFIQPELVLMENVRGIKKIGSRIINEFYDIGYRGEFYQLNAKDFGIPQNRERVFFLFFNEKRFDNIDERLFKFTQLLESKKFKSEPTNLKNALYGLPKLQAKTKKNSTTYESKENGFYEISSNKTNNYLKLINGYKKGKIFNHMARYNNPRDIEIFELLPQGENSLHESIRHLMPYKTRDHIFKDKYFKLDENKVCKTITAHMSFDCNMYIHPTQARGLTPREAARVQSFPDNFEFMGPYTKWYEQIGNAVPPLLAKKIGEAILEVS